MIVSATSSILFKDLAKEAPGAAKWLQTYLFENSSLTYDFVKQAEDLRFGAIVISVDTPVSALRYFNKRNGWKDLHKKVNYDKYNEKDDFQTDRATWVQLKELIDSTSLPVIVKGILTAEDARLCYENGAKGIIVSNHGGREIDGTISSVSFDFVEW